MTDGPLLLDTNAAIALLNQRTDATVVAAAFGPVILPLFAVGELEYGARNSENPTRNLRTLENLVTDLAILNPDRETAAHYGEIRARLRRKGRPIPPNDLWIAALALQHGLPVLTRDSHFDYVDGITVVGW